MHLRTDLDYPSGTFMPEHDREVVGELAAGEREVGVADPGRGEPNPNLARPGRGEVNLADDRLTAHFVQYGRPHDRGTGSWIDLISQNSS